MLISIKFPSRSHNIQCIYTMTSIVLYYIIMTIRCTCTHMWQWACLAELVSITPVEYQGKRICRYYGYKLMELSAYELNDILDEMKTEESPKIWEDSGMLCYQYPAKPLLIIKDGKFFTTEETWDGGEFTHRQIMHQASILLRILHSHGLASYNRKAVPRKRFTPYKYRK